MEAEPYRFTVLLENFHTKRRPSHIFSTSSINLKYTIFKLFKGWNKIDVGIFNIYI